ncbi:MAG: polysaccharide biosynthesis tyrosine autokinase [Acidobacteria bacterium]|nr:polysaccharide biosynthesis tyrosine autokinase [Acidobacteriota bacterium]
MHVIEELELYRLAEFNRHRAAWGLWATEPEDLNEQLLAVRINPQSDTYRNSIDNFLGNLDINPIRRSNLVEVRFSSQDPELASRITNRLADDYIERNLQVRWDATQRASEWLSRQLVGLKGRLERSQDAVQQYARENSILFVAQEQDLTNATLQQLQEEFTSSQSVRFQKESLYNLLGSSGSHEVPGALQNKLIQDLRVQLAGLQRKRAELSAKFKAEYPTVIQVQKQIDAIEQSLAETKAILTRDIADEYSAALDHENQLRAAVEAQKALVNQIGEKSIQYNILKREADTNRELYVGLLQRMKEAEVSAGMSASNIRIVDAAEVPKKPVRPRVALNLAFALFLGLGFGIGLAFFQEYMDNTLKDPDETLRYLRLPSLAVIPSIHSSHILPAYSTNGNGNGNKSLVAWKVSGKRRSQAVAFPEILGGGGDESGLAEFYRQLRTSILLSRANKAPRSLLITSAFVGEGKTTTAVNIAITMSQLGDKVLLVDSDMRKPRCHKLLGIPNPNKGLATFLTGQSSWDEIIQNTHIPNLFLVPCGPLPPNPSELFYSLTMQEFITRVSGQFKFIVFDSPPVLRVSDARILAGMVDAVAVTVHGGRTPRDGVRRAKDQLLAVNANVIGVILNNLDFSTSSYGYYYDGAYDSAYGDAYSDQGEDRNTVTHSSV